MRPDDDAPRHDEQQPIGDHPLSFLGHELRTPLAGIIGLAGSLLNTPLEPSQREIIRTIEAAGDHLAAVVDRAIPRRAVLLGGAGRAFEPAPFDPGLLAVTVGRLLSPQAAQRGIELSVHPHRHLPAKMLGDAVAVRQVLVNLVANAVRETTAGSVTVRVRPERSGSAIRFEVADTAGGLPEFALARLRGTKAGKNPGLGLSICHQLVTRMDGHIDAISELGRGTLVWFTVALTVVQGVQPSAGTVPADAARVLVASDDPVNAQVAMMLLQRLGYAVDLVANGIDALRAWRLTPYDICLLDATLPQLDGAEVTSCIRRLEDKGPRTTPVVGLVAGTTASERQRCTAAGMDAMLAKPIELGTLMALLARYAPSSRAEEETGGRQLVAGRGEGGAA